MSASRYDSKTRDGGVWSARALEFRPALVVGYLRDRVSARNGQSVPDPYQVALAAGRDDTAAERDLASPRRREPFLGRESVHDRHHVHSELRARSDAHGRRTGQQQPGRDREQRETDERMPAAPANKGPAGNETPYQEGRKQGHTGRVERKPPREEEHAGREYEEQRGMIHDALQPGGDGRDGRRLSKELHRTRTVASSRRSAAVAYGPPVPELGLPCSGP